MMETSRPERHTISFGVFELDLKAGELRKSGVKVKLQEQPFQVLVLLLENPGETVTREELVTKLWPDGTFVEFDRSLNIAVNKIRDALGDSASNPRFVETLPRRGYRFIAPVEVVGKAAPAALDRPTTPTRHRGFMIGSAVVAGVALVTTARWLERPPTAEPRVVPLTSYGSQEQFPSFSPEGREIAFSWNGKGNHDIYRKLVGDGKAIQLTDDPADELSPSWSPDGRHIAFVRILGAGRAGVYIVPALGGKARKVAEGADLLSRWGDAPPNSVVCWTPDSSSLIYSDQPADTTSYCLYLVSIETGEKHQITSPPPEYKADEGASFSPDGRKLVFSRVFNTYARSDLYVLALSDSWMPLGQPVAITRTASLAASPVWTPDGREIVFSAGSWGARSVWRVAASGSGPARRTALGQDADLIALSPDGSRLAYTKRIGDVNIWRIQLDDRGVSQTKPERFIHTTGRDTWPDIAPDGSLVYQSDRTGVHEIWISDEEGANQSQVTHFGHGLTGSPRWSPDGHLIAFDSDADAERFDVYVIDPGDGRPERITTSRGHDNSPTWSHDGEWIYFSSTRTGQREIWKKKLRAGGPAEQVTRNGGRVARETPDGKFLFFTRPRGDPMDWSDYSLWKMPLQGEPATEFLSGIHAGDFAVTNNGVFFRPTANAGGYYSIWYQSFATGAKHVVVDELIYPFGSMAVSPDGRWLLFCNSERLGDDLMLVENFR